MLSDPPGAPAAATLEVPLSQQLREATREQHERAEGSAFVEALMAGRLDADACADLHAQLHAIYSALEAAGRSAARQPRFAPLVLDELLRVPSLEADLAALRGPAWREQVRTLPATQRYVERLAGLAARWPAGYVAHAYTRYLGDLSGGQVIRRVLERDYGLPAEAVSFYHFDRIPKPKPFKDRYRELLDAIEWRDGERERVLDEARHAFDANSAVFADLAAAHLR